MFSRRSRAPLPPLSESENSILAQLKNHVAMLAAEIGARSLTSAPENLETAAKYIEFTLAKYNYSISLQEFDVEVSSAAARKDADGLVIFEQKHHRTRNVIAELPGGNKSDEIIILGAHYDSVYDCPAANDNGSGVAALLELARLLSEFKPKRTVRFVAFTNEEPPFFGTDDWGADRYAKLCKQRGENIVAMVSLETMGYFCNEPDTQEYPLPAFKVCYPDAGDFIAFVSNLRSKGLLDRFTSAFKNATQFPSESAAVPEQIRGVGFSDHAAFWQQGYKAIMVTDTAFLRYPHYHTHEDTPEKLNYESLARIVQALNSVVKHLSTVN